MQLLQCFETVHPSDEVTQTAEDASRRLGTLLNVHRDRFQVSPAESPGESVEIPLSAIQLLFDILTSIAQGNGVTLIPMQAQLPIQHSADFLNISRLCFIRLLDEGKIPSHGVGTDRRVVFRDLANHKERSDAERRQALDELAALGQEIDEGY
jgi:excisionase family DNA binding protein